MTAPAHSTPGNNLSGETQVTLISEDDLEAQEVEEQRQHPPQAASCEFGIGAGRMALMKDGSAIQIPAAVRAGIVTLSRLYQMIFEGRRVCDKYDQPCIYAAVPRRRGSSKKNNVAYVQMIALDLDGTIQDEAQLQKFRRWCSLFASILYSTARHDPANGLYRLRALLPVNASLSYEEARLVARAICGQLAAFLGTSEGIDACCERAFQPMLLPGWADQRLADQAICELYEGDVMDVTVPLAAARAELEEAEAEKRARACAVVATRRPRLASTSVVAAVEGVDADGIDRLARAQADLDDLGPVPAGSGRSNKDLFKAAAILRDWGLELDEAIQEMRSRYSDQDSAWLEAKTRSAYDAGAGSPRTGWRLRAAQAESSLTLEGMIELGQCAGDASVTHATPPVKCPTSTNAPLVFLIEEEEQQVEQQVEHRSWRREVHARHLAPLPSFRGLRARVTGLKSATGTGKNVHLKPAIQELMAEGGRIVTLAHRRSLTRAQSAVWGLPCYLDSLTQQIDGSTSICLDSVHRIAAGPVDVLILDEVEQVIRHLYSATIRHRSQVGVVFSALRDLLRRARRIILMDADLGPLSIWATRVLLGEETSEEIIINTWKPEGTIRVRSQDAMQAEVLADVRAGTPLWIYNTSREAAQRTAHLIRGAGVEPMLVHSGTTGLPEVQACLADPSLFKRHQVIVATPSVGTGVSVDDVGHWKVYGDCTSGAGPTAPDAKQGLCRVRHPVQITICVHGRVSYNPTNAEEILADLLLQSEKTLQALKGQTWTTKYQIDNDAPAELHPADFDITRLQAEVQAAEARDGNQLHETESCRGSLLPHLEAIGYTLAIIPDDATVDPEAAKADRKAAKEAVKAEWVDSVVSSPSATTGEIQALEDAGASTPEAEATLAKAKIEDFYGREAEPELVERDDRGRRRGHCRTAAHVLAWQRGEGQAVLRLDRLDSRAGVSAQLRHQGRKAALAAGLWTLFGIKDLEQDASNGTTLKDPGNIGSIAQLRAEVKRYLGITIKPGTKAMVLARSLAAQAGFRLHSTRSGSNARTYTLERDSVSEVVTDSAAYYERLTDPHRNVLTIEDQEQKRAEQERMQDILAGILAA